MDHSIRAYSPLLPVSQGYSEERGTFPRVTHPSAARTEVLARLACVKPAASVRSEPGSNSQVESTKRRSLTAEPLHITRPLTGPDQTSSSVVHPSPKRQDTDKQ